VVEETVDLLGVLRKRAADVDLDFLREAVAVLAEALMEAEVSVQIGAGYRGRTPERVTQRNGYRPRRWDTQVGTVDLQVP
jgi:transposase-like protein